MTCCLHIPFDPVLKRKLKAIAAKEDRSLTSLVVHIMRDYAQGRRDVVAPNAPGEDITDATRRAIEATRLRQRNRRVPS